MDTFLKANAEFQAAYPGAKLERVESNRGVEERHQGRYYLRYHHDGGATGYPGLQNSPGGWALIDEDGMLKST